jgi:hypothetical protein
MDDIKLTAQQRFDLLEMTRLRSYIQEAFADIISDIFGAAHHNDGAAGFLQKRPLIVQPFKVTKVGAPSVTMLIERSWSVGADGTLTAHVYDQSGSRITGPNSPVSRTAVVTAAPTGTPRFLMVRRVVGGTDDTPEVRKFYTSAGGHASTSVNTRTIDDYEWQDSITSADTDATLSAAGWVNVATFETDATPDIDVGPTMVVPSVERDLLTWAVAHPAADQTIVTLFENIQVLVQLMKRMRIGEGARVWTDDITNDAAFDEEGGLRYGKGDTLDTGLSDVHTRVQGASEIVTDCNKTAAVLGDLEDHMSSVSFARPASAGYGHRYATAIGSTTEAVETKYWDVSPIVWRSIPSNGANLVLKDPWELEEIRIAAGAYENQWYLDGALGEWNLTYKFATSSLTNILLIPIQVPHNSRIMKVHFLLDSDIAFDGGDVLKFQTNFRYVSKSSGGYTTVKDNTYDNSDGSPFDGTPGEVVIFDAISGGDTLQTADNTARTYFARLYLTSAGDPGVVPDLRAMTATITTYIREASHVY